MWTKCAANCLTMNWKNYRKFQVQYEELKLNSNSKSQVRTENWKNSKRKQSLHKKYEHKQNSSKSESQNTQNNSKNYSKSKCLNQTKIIPKNILSPNV